MQTEYRLLYRYMNPTTNTAITNEADYEKTEEFYTEDHALNITSTQIGNMEREGYYFKYAFDGDTVADYATALNQQADSEREQLITSNMANENKSNNLYVYTGTKKLYHKQFVPEQLGYKVRDWTKVPSSQIPSGPDDYSKHFVMVGGSHLGVDGAYLICKPKYFDGYMTHKVGSTKCLLNISTNDVNNLGYKNNNQYFSKNVYIENISDLINEEVFFEWCDPFNENLITEFNESVITATKAGQIENGAVIDGSGYFHDASDNDVVPTKVTYFKYTNNTGYYTSTAAWNYIFFNNTIGNSTLPATSNFTHSRNVNGGNKTDTATGWLAETLVNAGFTNYGVNITIGKNNVVRAIIPAHYEDTGELPYIIRDTYEKVSLSPWMLHSIHHSLESSLESAKKLVSMIGIKNVKLIKNVPVDQFIKLK